MEQFFDVYGLSNLVKEKTCFTKNHSSAIDVFLTNPPNFFQSTFIFETGLSDCHCLIMTSFRASIPRLEPKHIKHRSYKHLNTETFLTDLRHSYLNRQTTDPELSYINLTNNFEEIVDRHAPIKTKFIRGNSAPFMNKALKKAIYLRTKLKNRLNKNPSEENKTKYKKQRNVCVALRKRP